VYQVFSGSQQINQLMPLRLFQTRTHVYTDTQKVRKGRQKK